LINFESIWNADCSKADSTLYRIWWNSAKGQSESRITPALEWDDDMNRWEWLYRPIDKNKFATWVVRKIMTMDPGQIPSHMKMPRTHIEPRPKACEELMVHLRGLEKTQKDFAKNRWPMAKSNAMAPEHLIEALPEVETRFGERNQDGITWKMGRERLRATLGKFLRGTKPYESNRQCNYPQKFWLPASGKHHHLDGAKH
jgi:hypothetical protein